LFVPRTIIAIQMLQAQVKSAQKSKRNKVRAPQPSSEAASANTRFQGSTNSDDDDPIESSPAKAISRGGLSTPKPTSANQNLNSQQKAALETWNHAERVSQGLASPIKAMKSLQPVANANQPIPPANDELQQLLNQESGSASRDRIEEFPSILSSVQNLRKQITTAVAATYRATPPGEPHIHQQTPYLRPEMYTAMANLEAQRAGPQSVASVAHQQILHELAAMREQMMEGQKQLAEQRDINAQLTEQLRLYGSASQPILVPSLSRSSEPSRSASDPTASNLSQFQVPINLTSDAHPNRLRDALLAFKKSNVPTLTPVHVPPGQSEVVLAAWLESPTAPQAGSERNIAHAPQNSPHQSRPRSDTDTAQEPSRHVPSGQIDSPSLPQFRRPFTEEDKAFFKDLLRQDRAARQSDRLQAPARSSTSAASAVGPETRSPSIPRSRSDENKTRTLERTIYKRQQAVAKANAQDEAIIKQLQTRIKQREEAEPRLTIRVKKGTTQVPTRAEERRLAVLTDDRDLLKHGSFRCKREKRSDDEEQDVLDEVRESILEHNRVNPLDIKTTHTKYGHAKHDFVADSDSEVSPHSGDDDDQDEDGTGRSDEPSDSTPDDDPNDPDWQPSSSRTPSPSRKTISKKDYELFQKFKRSQASGNPQQDSVSRITVAVAEQPPDHGEWDDIHHLMTTFKDKHATYAHRCGGIALSVWDCYSSIAKENIIEQLRSTPQGQALNRTAAYLAKLSNEALYALLQQELGLAIDTEVEQALKAVRFKGNVLDIPSWVSFRTSWRQVLSRATKSGEVQPKRLSELFRKAIPDKFITEWFDARKHLTWSEAYDAMLSNLNDSRWLVSYNKAMREHAATPAQKGGAAAPGHLATSAASAKISKPSSANTQPPPVSDSKEPPAGKSAPQENSDRFDPLKYRNSYNVKNVNPNFKRSLNENPDNIPCSRCLDYTHRWGPQFCTVAKRKDDTLIEPPLTATEFATRLKGRWDKGFFFSNELQKDISKHKSPTVRDAAHAASSASKKINGRDE
jgi:hypothetical protein